MIQINVKPISELQRNITPYLTLFNESRTPAFFAHPQYLFSWWKHLSRGEAKLLTLTQEDVLIGYIALFKDQPSSPWRLVGAKDESDYLDLVTTEENNAAAWEAILTHWKEHKSEWGSILLESIPDKSSTKTTLAAKAQEFNYTAEVTQQDLSPIITLLTTYEQYLEQIDPSLKKRIQRFTQAIQEDDVLSFKTLTKPDEIKMSMPAFIELHKASGNEKASFWNPQREAFFLEMPVLLAEEGLVKLEVLEVSNDPAAMVLSFVYQNRLLGYNSGFHQYRYGHLGVGTVLAAHSIEQAIKAGYSHYDFMRGEEAYKLEFNAKPEPVWDIKLS